MTVSRSDGAIEVPAICWNPDLISSGAFFHFSSLKIPDRSTASFMTLFALN